MISTILMLISIVLGALGAALVSLVIGAVFTLRMAALFQPLAARKVVRRSAERVGLGLPKAAYAGGRAH